MKVRRVVVDTYALMAIVFDEVSERAREVLMRIRDGGVEGLVPVTVVYEYAVHWFRGRIPGLRDIEELMGYLEQYFEVVELSIEDYVKAAGVKARADDILRSSQDPNLRERKLGLVDSTVLWVAIREGAPVLTSDEVLMYVARELGVETIW